MHTELPIRQLKITSTHPRVVWSIVGVVNIVGFRWSIIVGTIMVSTIIIVVETRGSVVLVGWPEMENIDDY